MKFKKFATSVMAGAMALSLTAPAFASGSSELNATTDYEGSMSVPTISITVPDSGAVVVNPYGLSVDVPGSTTSEKSTSQIISPTQHITNASNVALNVDVTVTGTLPTGKKDVTFATATTQNASKPVTTNSIFMFFEIGPADSVTAEAEWPEAGYVAKPTADQAVKQILVSNKATTVKNAMTLGIGNTDNTFAAYRLTGDVASAPTRAWAEDDAVAVSVAFTFTPTATAEE